MGDPFERLLRLMESYPVEVDLHGGMWRRIHAFIDRNNHDPRTPEDCRLNADEDLELVCCMLIERGLEAYETADGLAGGWAGEIEPLEQQRERMRRWREKRQQQRPVCDTCHGEGTVEVGVSQDSFGNWDTEQVRCSDCDGSGRRG